MSRDPVDEAQRLQEQAAAEGFDWPQVEGVWAKLREEIEELRCAADPAHRAEEFGDVMFVLINLARHLEIDAATALVAANCKFARRYALVRSELERLPPLGDPRRLECMEALWQQAKRRETKAWTITTP